LVLLDLFDCWVTVQSEGLVRRNLRRQLDFDDILFLDILFPSFNWIFDFKRGVTTDHFRSLILYKNARMSLSSPAKECFLLILY